MKKIKGIIFDVDGTLYSAFCLKIFISFRLLFYCLLHPFRAGVTLKIISCFRRAQETLRQNKIFSKDLSEEQIKLTATLSNTIPDDIREVVRKWFDLIPLTFIKWCRRKQLAETIRALKVEGYHIGLLSDYPAKKKVQVLGIESLIDVMVCSMDTDIGIFKPDVRPFKETALKLGVQPGEAVYVGDRIDVDPKGALDAGMLPVIIGRHEKSDQFISCKRFKDLPKLIKKIREEN